SAYRRTAPSSPRPRSCAAKLWRMNTVPIGRITRAKVLSAPVVTAASGSSPSGATISASENPTTEWVARARTMGEASASRVRVDGAIGSRPAYPKRGPDARARDRDGREPNGGHDRRAGSRGADLRRSSDVDVSDVDVDDRALGRALVGPHAVPPLRQRRIGP